MSVLWRYALQNYFRVFFLSVFTFIAVLIISRFKEIARVAALSGDLIKTGLFVVYQIPTILPIAIPISSLIGALLLFQSLSRSFELTALRASGLSFWKIISPLLAASSMLSILNFSLCAEIAPYCRRESKLWVYHETTQNPLILLQRQKLVKLKQAFLDMKVKDDETVKDLILIIPNEHTQRLTFLSASKLWIEKEELMGKEFRLISYFGRESGFDNLMIENQSLMSTGAPLLSTALKKNRPKLDANALNLKMLTLHQKEKALYIEIPRRVSLSLAVFSFTLLGCAFGIEQGRNPSKKNLIFVLFLSLSVLMSYLLGKELKKFPIFSILAFLLPHPLIWGSSIFRFYQISRGKG